MTTIDCLSEITGLHYEIEMDGAGVTITWLDADGIEQTVDSIAPGGVLAACDVPAEDQAILCEEVARIAGFLGLAAKAEG